MAKKNFKTGINERNQPNDAFMYDDAPLAEDDIFDLIHTPDEAIVEENSKLKARVTELEQKIAEHGIENAIVRKQDGTMSYGRFTITQTGLKIPENASTEELAEIGIILRNLDRIIAWNIGDWAKHLHHTFNVSYEKIAEQFGYQIDTLYSYASVCEAIPTLIRNQGQSFSHCRLVMKMKPRDQRKWLERSTKHNWTVAELRTAIREENRKNSPTLSNEDLATRLFSPETRPKLSGWKGLFSRAGEGDPDADNELRRRITQVRDWLDTVEENLDSESKS